MNGIGARPLVLVIEDDAGVAALVADRIEDLGCEVVTAASGKEVLELLAGQLPLLMLLDYSLPDMNGTTLLERIAERDLKIPPFIVATGAGDEYVAVDLMRRGAQNYLIKDRDFLDVLPVAVERALHEIRLSQRLAEAEGKLRRAARVLEGTSEAMFVTDDQHRILESNLALERMTGYLRDEISGQPASILLPAWAAEKSLARAVLESLADHGHWQGELPVQCKNGAELTGWFSISRIDGGIDEPPNFVTFFSDITERKVAQRALIESEQRFHDVADISADWIWEIDAANRYTYASDSVRALLGYAPAEIVGKSPFDLMSPDEAAKIREAFRAIATQGKSFRDLENTVLDAEGKPHVTLTSGTPIRSASGEVIGYRGVDRDISERKRLEKELIRQARIDYLTGVSNRRDFVELAESELSRAVRYGANLSICMIDVDFFKRVNDSHGHKTGDTLLKRLADVCRRTLREVDVIGRLGGEEFAILMPETDNAEAVGVAERLREALANEPVPTEGDSGPLHFTVSIGVVSLISRKEQLDELLNLADKALYEAKNSGRNKVCIAKQ